MPDDRRRRQWLPISPGDGQPSGWTQRGRRSSPRWKGGGRRRRIGGGREKGEEENREGVKISMREKSGKG
jgi:hypothetical protein